MSASGLIGERIRRVPDFPAAVAGKGQATILRWGAQALKIGSNPMISRMTMDELSPQIAGVTFIASSYEVFMGREVEPGIEEIIRERAKWNVDQVLRDLLSSSEFEHEIYGRLEIGFAFKPGRYVGPIQMSHRYWACERLPTSEETKAKVMSAISWRSMLIALLADRQLMALSSCPPLEYPQLTEQSELDSEDAPFIFSLTPFDPRRHSLILRDPEQQH